MRRPPFLFVLALLAACGGGGGGGEHPLAGRDPASGFVAGAYDATAKALASALEQQIGNPDRLLTAGDPLAVGRLVALLEEQLGTCPGGNCPQTSDADAPLSAFSPEDLRPVLRGAAETLDGWAAIAVAHEALGLANLLDQVGEIPDAARQAIGTAANALESALADAAAFAVFDPSALVPSKLAGGPIAESILAHPSAPRPSPATAAAAAATIDAVATLLVARWGDDIPFGQSLPAPDAAIQTLLRAPLVRRFASRDDLSAHGDALHAQAIAFANEALARTLDEKDWDAWAVVADAWARGVAFRNALFERAPPIGNDVEGFIVPFPGDLDDPNARRFVSNVATEEGALESFRPHVVLRTPFDEVPDSAVPGVPLPPYVPPPEHPLPDPSDGWAWHTARAIAVSWGTRSGAPIDHVDLRVMRDGGPVFLHFVYRPDASGDIATGTLFDPATDPDAPSSLPPLASEYVVYVIHVVAVDRLGRSSGIACTSVPFRFGWDPRGEIPEPIVGLACGDAPGEAPVHSAISGPIRALRYTTFDGGTAMRYDPWRLARVTPGSAVTFQNDDVVPHRLASVFTPPYGESDLSAFAIGGTVPLDFGEVAPGGSSTITLPSSIPTGYRWTLFDRLMPSRPVTITTELRGLFDLE